MKYLISLLLISYLSAQDIISLFNNKEYDKVCTYKNIQANNNQKILSLIGISCIKSDDLYFLNFIIPKLRKSHIGRLNNIYFYTILFEKRLLYSFLFDGLKLDDFNFPDTDYILSFVFNKIKNKKYVINNGRYIMKKNKETIVLYKIDDKMFIDIFQNNKLLKRRWYR